MLLFYFLPIALFLFITYFDTVNTQQETRDSDFVKLFINSLSSIKNYFHTAFTILFCLIGYYFYTNNESETARELSLLATILGAILFFFFYKKIFKFLKRKISVEREIKLILDELKKAKQELNNQSFEIIETGIKDYIYNNKKDLIQHIRNGDSPIVFIYNIINMASSDHFTSGKYPYRNHIGLEYGKGYYLHKLFNDTVDEKVVLGLISKKEAIDIKNEMNQRMSYLINKALPFH